MPAPQAHARRHARGGLGVRQRPAAAPGLVARRRPRGGRGARGVDHRHDLGEGAPGPRRLHAHGAEEPRRLAWRQELEESPFERILTESSTEVCPRRPIRRHAGRADRPQQAARLDPPRPVPAAQRGPAPARAARSTGSRRAGPRGGVAMRWWGWGEDGHEVHLPEPALGLLRSELAVEDGQGLPRVDARGGRPARAAAAATACAPRCVRLLGPDSPRRPRGARAPRRRAAAIPDLVRLRTGDGAGAPDAVVFPGYRRRGARGAGAVRRRAGRRGALRRRHERGRRGRAAARRRSRRRDLARPPPAGPRARLDRTSLTARLEAGRLRPRCRGAARRARRHARPLPAVLRVLDGRRLGRHALGRPGLHGLRADRRARRGADPRDPAPAAPSRPATCPPRPPGRRLRELRRRLGGHARRDHRRRRCGCDPLRRRGATRAGRSRRSRRATRPSGSWSRRGAAPDVARLSDREETRLRSPSPPPASAPRPRAGATCAPRGHEGGCLAIIGFEGDAEGRGAPPPALGRAHALRRAASRSAAGPAKPGCEAASRAPYLRDDLLDRGVMVETLETATTWTQPGALHAAVGAALRDALGGARHAAARHVPRLAPLSVRSVAVLHLPGPPGAGRPDRPVARRQERRLRRDRRRRRHDHPPPRGRRRPRTVDARPRWASSASRCSGRPRPASIPPGS